MKMDDKEDVLQRFAKPWDNSDIELVIEGVSLHCHSLFLKFNSPVFAAMFGENFAEGRSKKVKLPGNKAESFGAFLTMFYPTRDEMKVTDYWLVLPEVLSYCDEYQVDSVRKLIDKAIVLDMFNGDFHRDGMDATLTYQAHVMEHLLLAERFNLDQTKKFAVKYLISDTNCISYQRTVYSDLSKESKMRLLNGKLKKLGEAVVKTYNDTANVVANSGYLHSALSRCFDGRDSVKLNSIGQKCAAAIFRSKDLQLVLSLGFEEDLLKQTI